MAVITGLLNEYNAATGDQTFLQKVEMAILNAAQAIAGEAVGVNGTQTDSAHRPNRMALCKAVSQPGAASGYATAFSKLIMAQSTCDPTSDTNIQNLVNACWNTVAGQV